MHRIFKKSHDPAARKSEAPARRPRRRRLAVESIEGRQLLSLLCTEFKVNAEPVPPVAQFESDTASSSNGVSVVVWTETFSDLNASRLDHDIFAQLYSSSGQKLGGQIQ